MANHTLSLWIVAWSLHAYTDAIVISSAVDLKQAIELAVPICICALLDSLALTFQLSKLGATNTEMAVAVCMFALMFPVGAWTGFESVHAGQESSNQVGLSFLRLFAAGAFLYLAIFEINPPHTHGRRDNILIATTFVTGFSVGLI